ncbi:hypothetical protein [Celeribacter sp.]|uniref:hypothetical protein n=1 Tax=Celeribacter sp. TaxID=1890673 RepID=UPI003A917535
MLKGRLGLDSVKVPHADRAGCLYPARGALTARDGTLAFVQGETTPADALSPGGYAIPLQTVSMTLLGPGSTVSHDALRLLAHARTLSDEKIISAMIERIKTLIEGRD